MARGAAGDKPAINIEDDSKKKAGWNLPQSVHTLAAEYTEFYNETTGQKVTEDQVVAEGLKQALGGDKAFVKWKAKKAAGGAGKPDS